MHGKPRGARRIEAFHLDGAVASKTPSNVLWTRPTVSWASCMWPADARRLHRCVHGEPGCCLVMTSPQQRCCSKLLCERRHKHEAFGSFAATRACTTTHVPPSKDDHVAQSVQFTLFITSSFGQLLLVIAHCSAARSTSLAVH